MKTKYLTIDDLTTTMVIATTCGRLKRHWADLLYKKSRYKRPNISKQQWTMVWVHVVWSWKGKINFKMHYIDTDLLMEHLSSKVFPKRFNTKWKKVKLQKWFDQCLMNIDSVDKWKPWNMKNSQTLLLKN